MNSIKPVKEAIILAGGLGTRLGDLTKNTPKPLLKINDIPFLEYLLFYLSKNGIETVILAVNHLSEQFDYLQNGLYGLRIVLSRYDSQGTLEAIRLASQYLTDNQTVIMNGDTLFDFPLQKLVSFEPDVDSIILGYVQQNRYGTITTYFGKSVDAIEKKFEIIDTGIMLLRENAIKELQNSKDIHFWRSDFFYKQVESNQLKCYKHEIKTLFIDIGLEESFYQSSKLLKNYLKNKIAFLDRDGVINIYKSYMYKIEDFELCDNVIENLNQLQLKGYQLYVVTNQGGVELGKFSEDELLILHKHIKQLLLKNGIYISDILYETSYQSNRRKPNSGMLDEIIEALPYFSYFHSFMIGDSESDVLTANNVGIRGIKINSNENIKPYLENHKYIE